MTLYSNTLASQSYRFKRLMLAYSDTEIEQVFRNARLLFEKLDKVLDSPNETTEEYRIKLEKLAQTYKAEKDINILKTEIEQQYDELKKLIPS